MFRVWYGICGSVKLRGLHLIDFDRSKLQSDSKAVAEYNRLRSLYTPHLDQLPSVTEPCKLRNVQHKSHCKGKRVKTQHKVNSDNAQVVQESCSPNMPENSKQEQVALPVFQYSDISSVDEEFQMRTCAQLNLRLFPANKQSVEPAWSDVTRNVQSVICKHTNMPTLTQIYNISGIGGNCLFRALSLGITNQKVSMTSSEHTLSTTCSTSTPMMRCELCLLAAAKTTSDI